MNRIFPTIILLATIACQAYGRQKPTKIEVSNPSGISRTEVVGLRVTGQEAEKLLHGKATIETAKGEDTPWQITSDKSTLLIWVDIPSKGKETYTIRDLPEDEHVCPALFATGAFHPERLDDIAWENDKIGFRGYGPAFANKKYKAYGYDVMVKSTKKPILGYRYRIMFAPATLAAIDSLKKVNPDSARRLDNSVSYHIDHGNGLDCYAVGASLGCGASALVSSEGGLCFANCFGQYEILENGPIRYSMRLTFGPTVVDGDTIRETRTITLDAGTHLNHTHIEYTGATKPLRVATGIVTHNSDTGYAQEGILAYNDPTDQPKVDNGEIYTGVVLTTPPDSARFVPLTPAEAKACRGARGHILGYTTVKNGTYDYMWGAAWSRHDIANFQQWVERLKQYAEAKQSPLKVKVKR